MSATQAKVAKLNVVVAAVREWQRGAITRAEMERRADLTAEQTAQLPSIRTLDERDVAQAVAAILGL